MAPPLRRPEPAPAADHQPLIFISHKHTDHAIATAIRNFINEQSRGTFRIFQSSDATAIGPSVARELNAELQQALWEAKAVILVYTRPDQDWGYCMWECGVATKPASPATRIIVFQCAGAVPAVYSGHVSVDARTKEGLAPFVTQFMTEPHFLPNVSSPLTGFHSDGPEIAEAIAKFYSNLSAVLPQGQVNEWPAHPFAKLELAPSTVQALNATTSQLSFAEQKALILTNAHVVWADSEARRLFGLAPVEEALPASELIARWRQARPTGSESWVDELAQQIIKCARWQFPELQWTQMQAVHGNPRAPVVTWVKRLPSGAMQFRIHFFPFDFLTATPVAMRMVRSETLYYRILPQGGEAQIKVIELLRELDARQVNRIPFLDDARRAVYLCHRSLLDQFMARRVSRGALENLAQLTLADVLAESPDLKALISRAFAFVPRTATLAQAQAEMAKIPECRDVFVTASGAPTEPIEGLVTDVMLTAGAN